MKYIKKYIHKTKKETQNERHTENTKETNKYIHTYRKEGNIAWDIQIQKLIHARTQHISNEKEITKTIQKKSEINKNINTQRQKIIHKYRQKDSNSNENRSTYVNQDKQDRNK